MPADLAAHPDRWVSSATFAALLDLSARAFQRLKSAGRLPEPEVVFGRAARWRWKTVMNFLKSAGTDAGGAKKGPGRGAANADQGRC